jgi:hypothetical protein
MTARLNQSIKHIHTKNLLVNDLLSYEIRKMGGKVGKWVAKSGRWVAKLVARLLAKAALWIRIQTSLKNTKMEDMANTL